MSTSLGIGLLGLGTVGSAVARAIRSDARRIEAVSGKRVHLVAAAVRDPRKPRGDVGVDVTADAFRILDDANVRIVIEVIGGMDPCYDLHLAAFERGKHVVTANKELVAKRWDDLHGAARAAKRELRFEASVAGAVPIVASARQLGATRPRTLRALLNGTTTYICSQVEAGRSFDEALAEAQRLGYAEADPSADIDGLDPAYKLSILISLIDGRHFPPEQVRRTTLRGLDRMAFLNARTSSATVRYIASAEWGRTPTASVAPQEVPLDSPEGRAAGPMNVVRLETELAGPLLFSGAGAGGDATASAILGDVIQIARSSR